jgi:hypothetical protein
MMSSLIIDEQLEERLSGSRVVLAVESMFGFNPTWKIYTTISHLTNENRGRRIDIWRN